MEWLWPNNLFEKLKFLFKGNFKLKTHDKTYILPTLVGLVFAILLLCLLYLSLATNNNLIYLYTFFLIGISIASMWSTNSNVNRVNISSVKVDGHFADEIGYAEVILKNSSLKPIFNLDVYFSKDQKSNLAKLSASEETKIKIPLTLKQRGLHKIPKLTLASDFPFGFLRSWKVHKSEQDYFVFPERKGVHQFPQTHADDNSSLATNKKTHLSNQSEMEYWGHRKYRNNDSPRQIDWKAYARTRKLLVKDYQKLSSKEVQLNWNQTKGLSSFEDRLNQLALWIDMCETQGISYSLELGFFQFPLDKGPQHYLHCLKKLAQLSESDMP